MSCDFCGRLVPDRVLVCPCGRLVHGKKLAAKAREAEELEGRGELAGAREAWSATLALLPEDAMQASEIRARIAKLDGQHARAGKGEVRGAAGVASALGVFLLGLKTKLGLVLGLAKSSKVLLTGVTMLVSLWFYAQIFGPSFAALFVVLIWIHEMGHVAVLRWYGVRASAPIFIPGLGAVVRLKQQLASVVEDAWCGLGGPLLGSAGGFVALAAGRLLPSELLLAAGHSAIALNLFNLVPIFPLDGGRAAQILTPRLWLVALAAAVGLAFQFSEPLIVIACLLPLGRISGAARARQLGGADAAFHAASTAQRLAVTVVYLGLAALLIATHVHFEPELKRILKKHADPNDLAWISSATE